jgi:hypothetical protein
MITLLATFVVCGLLITTLLWVKTPIYRVQREQVERLLQWVLMGQATENDWRVFCDYPIRHDELLENIRLACESIEDAHFTGESRAPYLFSNAGLEAIEQQLERLERERGDA